MNAILFCRTYTVSGEWKIFNLQKYKPGQSYSSEHMEHGNDEISCLRVLGWMVYLNDVNDGGETYWLSRNLKNLRERVIF